MSLGAASESGDDGRDGNDASDAPRCSAKGCRAAADTELSWRNPRLHDTSRVKSWLACADHADHLADFLSRRGFLLARAPHGADPSADGPAPG